MNAERWALGRILGLYLVAFLVGSFCFIVFGRYSESQSSSALTSSPDVAGYCVKTDSLREIDNDTIQRITTYERCSK